MSRITDSRDPQGGIGFPILQHHRYDLHGWSLSERGCIIGVRVEDRDDDKGGLGSWMRPKNEENVGDITQWLLWPKNSRPISGFSQAWPAILDYGGGPSSTKAGAPPPPPPPGAPDSGASFSFAPSQPDANALKGKAKKGQVKVQGQTAQVGNLTLTVPPNMPDANSPKYKGKNGMKKWQADVAKMNQAAKAPPPPPAAPPADVMGDTPMLPVIDDLMLPDGRFLTVVPRWPEQDGKKIWPKFPLGWYGTALPGTNENLQVEYFLPTDPRLVAVHKHGDVEMGSLVCEMKKGFKIDPEHSARLQSAFKVLKDPIGINIGAGAGGGNASPSNNKIAWNIGFSGLGDTQGGFVWERMLGMNPGGGGGTTVVQGDPKVAIGIVGAVSQSWSGAFDVGSDKDQHQLGTDSDGNVINSLHLSANAYFRRGAEDGPFNFSVFMLGDDYQKKAKVYCGFNPNSAHDFVGGSRSGKWDWWTTVPYYQPPWKPPPDDPDPTPTGGQTTPPDRPGGSPDAPDRPTIAPGTIDWSLIEDRIPGIDGPVPIVKPLDVPQIPQGYLCCLSETAFPTILGRPQMIVGGIPDLRKTTKEVPDEITDDHDRKAPVVARIEAFGQQAANEWIYTQRPTASRYVAGTADGGFVVLPPEIDMADDLNSWTIPACRAVSTTYFSVLRGATYFASGQPDLVSGAVKNGYRWGADASGNLLFDRTDASATPTTTASMMADGKVGIATAAPANAMHIATADVRMDLTNTAPSGALRPALGLAGDANTPTTDAQAGWLKIDIGGTTGYLPFWT